MVNPEHLRILREGLLSKLVVIPAETVLEKRFTIYGGCFTLGASRLEYILRMAFDNESGSLGIQVAYPIGGEQDAKLILEKLIFLCTEYL